MILRSNHSMNQPLDKLWDKEEYCKLRQTVIVFGGNLHTECPIHFFKDVLIFCQEKKEETSQVKGTFYITSKRFVFLPNDQFPHPKLIQAKFSSIKFLSGVANDKSMLIVDFDKAFINFQFLTTKPLYLCFHLLRNLAEATRKSQPQFEAFINQLIANGLPQLDQSSRFSSFELEFQPVEGNIELSQHEDEEESCSEEIDETLAHFLEPIQFFFDYCNSLHFDIHIKLRILTFISAFSFALKFFPFFPLVCLVLSLYILYEGWKTIDRPKHAINPDNPTTNTGSFATLQFFIGDWLQWNNPQKSLIFLQTTAFFFFSYIFCSIRLYVLICITSYIYFLIWPPIKKFVFFNIVNGFWFST